jgi:hypothetical protein
MEKVKNQLSLALNDCEQIFKIVVMENFDSNMTEAYKGNKAAIRRTRAQLQAIKKLCESGRKELTNIKHNLNITKG